MLRRGRVGTGEGVPGESMPLCQFFCRFVIAEKIFCDGTVGVLWAAGGVWTSISQVRAGEEVGVDEGPRGLSGRPSRRRDVTRKGGAVSCSGAVF